MASVESLPLLKILIIGNSGSGKSALLLRYCDDQFDLESSPATIGVDLKLKTLSIHGRSYKIHLLDTAGQERFRTLSSSYYRGAQGIILVYDISNRHSFTALEKWYEEAENNAMPGAITFLVGSKLDKSLSRGVTFEEGMELAERHGSSFAEVSAKTRENVKIPFVTIVDQIVKTPALLSNRAQATENIQLEDAASLPYAYSGDQACVPSCNVS